MQTNTAAPDLIDNPFIMSNSLLAAAPYGASTQDADGKRSQNNFIKLIFQRNMYYFVFYVCRIDELHVLVFTAFRVSFYCA